MGCHESSLRRYSLLGQPQPSEVGTEVSTLGPICSTAYWRLNAQLSDGMMSNATRLRSLVANSPGSTCQLVGAIQNFFSRLDSQSRGRILPFLRGKCDQLN